MKKNPTAATDTYLVTTVTGRRIADILDSSNAFSRPVSKDPNSRPHDGSLHKLGSAHFHGFNKYGIAGFSVDARFAIKPVVDNGCGGVVVIRWEQIPKSSRHGCEVCFKPNGNSDGIESRQHVGLVSQRLHHLPVVGSRLADHEIA